MPDEKPQEKQILPTATENTGTDPRIIDVEAPAEKARPSGPLNPVIFLLFMILAMIVILIVMNMRRSGNTLSSDGGTHADDPSVAALKADVKAGQMELNRQRMAMGLPPLEGGSEPMDDIAARLKTDADTLVSLANRFQQMLAEKDADITAKSSELIRLERVRQDLITENARLSSEYQRALVAGSETASLKKLLAENQATREALSSELATARGKLAEMSGAISGDEFADLDRRYKETLRAKEFFENRVKELEAQLGQMNLFAKSEDELLPAAVELFRRLRTLEGKKDSDNSTEYSKLGVELGSNVLHVLSFPTGSSELSAEEMAQLDHIAAEEVPDGDLTFIVGYASVTGDAFANQTLSSKRATAAAEYFAGRKRPGQRVQAVYIGQTNRFSSRIPERNQICEVWRIRAK